MLAASPGGRTPLLERAKTSAATRAATPRRMFGKTRGVSREWMSFIYAATGERLASWRNDAVIDPWTRAAFGLEPVPIGKHSTLDGTASNSGNQTPKNHYVCAAKMQVVFQDPFSSFKTAPPCRTADSPNLSTCCHSPQGGRRPNRTPSPSNWGPAGGGPDPPMRRTKIYP